MHQVEPVAAPGVQERVSEGHNDVGARLREVRRARRRTLRQVAGAARISESFLSQVERGLSNASVATLRRIAVALGVTIGDLFDQREEGTPEVLRAGSRPSLDFGILGRKLLLNPAPHRSFDMLVCEFEPGGSSGEEPYSHGDSEEVALVLRGSIVFELGADTLRLDTDDSVRYRSSVPHRVAANQSWGASVLFVTTPPSF